MADREAVFIVVCVGILMVGAVHTCWQMYKMVETDAQMRGLKHPKFWGFWAMNGNNSSGLLLYLIGRRKYPVVNDTKENRIEIERRKKKAGVGLIFLVAGAIGLMIIISGM